MKSHLFSGLFCWWHADNPWAQVFYFHWEIRYLNCAQTPSRNTIHKHPFCKQYCQKKISFNFNRLIRECGKCEIKVRPWKQIRKYVFPSTMLIDSWVDRLYTFQLYKHFHMTTAHNLTLETFRRKQYIFQIDFLYVLCSFYCPPPLFFGMGE